MRDPKRIGPMCAQLSRLWHEYPDLRLGQLIMNLAQTGEGKDPFYMEDEEMSIRMDAARDGWRFLKEESDDALN